MKRFIQKSVFVLFWIFVYALTLFYIPTVYYPQWIITLVLFLLFIIYLANRIIPSAKQDRMLAKVVKDYQSSQKVMETIRLESMKLKLECSACKTVNNYWSFLEDYKCNHCQSQLWSTSLGQLDTKYMDLFDKYDKARSFIDNVPKKMRPRLKAFINEGIIK